MRQFAIKVPASLANIGPGFDVLGVGLNLYLEIDVTIDEAVDTLADAHNAILSYTGLLAEKVPLESGRNLVTQCALYVLRAQGIDKFPPGTQIAVSNPVPLLRGLGSLASAIVGGIMLGNEIGQLGMDKNRLMDYALMIERHPDNIAAAMLGGFVGSYLPQLSAADEQAKLVPLEWILPKPETAADLVVRTPPPVNIGEYVKYPWNPKIKAVCIVPNFEVLTDDSRAVLPELYSRADVIFNLQRLSVLTSALSLSEVNHEVIFEAMKDKIHQPYRSTLIPGLTEVLQTVTPKLDPGLCGICLSGAGPTILCLATEGYDSIASKVMGFFGKNGIECDYHLLEVAPDGAVVEQK